MGKKSKRQKESKIDENEVILRNVFHKVFNMGSCVEDNIAKKQYSEAASRERDIITYVATKEKIITKASVALAEKTSRGDRSKGNHFGMVLTQRYRSLVLIEFVFRKNYDKVIEIHNEFASKYAHVVILGTYILEEVNFNADLKFIQIFYELALIQTGKSHCNIPIIKSYVLREMKDEPTDKIVVLRAYAIDALRVSKEYDHAIDLDSELLRIPNLLQLDPFEVTASLMISYIERYRVEKHQSFPSAKKRNNFLITRLFNTIPKGYERDEIHKVYKEDFLLAAAQWSYLCHKQDNNEEIERLWLDSAILYVELLARVKWIRRNVCYTCSQRSDTPSELQLVCSVCRVSCYCSIDHQRECWMKNEVQGTRLGHKVFCPVLKAFRIWMEAKESDDEEREAKMERRFNKECISFLAYGLGLKDKCFEVKDSES